MKIKGSPYVSCLKFMGENQRELFVEFGVEKNHADQ